MNDSKSSRIRGFIQIAFILTFFIVTYTEVGAQHIGIKGSYLVDQSEISYPDVDASTRNGFGIGLTGFHPISLSGLNLNIDILYSYKGYKLSNELNTNTGITFHFATTNLELPVTVNKELNIGSYLLFVKGGIYASYLLSGKIKDGISHTSMKLNNGADRLDYGGVLGCGTKLNKWIKIDIDYTLGLSQNKYRFGDYDISNKNRRFSVSLSYYLD